MSSRVGYLCVQGWGEGVVGSEIGPLVAGTGVDSITDANAAASPVLADYSTLVVGAAATSATFTTSLAMNPDDAALGGSVTVALLGVRVSPMTLDTVMRATMTVGANTYESAAALYGQEMDRTLPGGLLEGHELFGSGVTNIVFHDLPVSVLTTGVEFNLALDAGTIASTTIRIGSVFVGLQIPLNVNPRGFGWSIEPINDRFRSRAGVNYSSNGVMQRVCSFEAQRSSFELISGIGSTFYSAGVPVPNLFRASLASIGQPMLLSPYPYPLTNQAWSGTVSDVDQRVMSVRQNFFSMYGLLDRSADTSIEEYNQELKTEYRTRLRFGEVR